MPRVGLVYRRNNKKFSTKSYNDQNYGRKWRTCNGLYAKRNGCCTKNGKIYFDFGFLSKIYFRPNSDVDHINLPQTEWTRKNHHLRMGTVKNRLQMIRAHNRILIVTKPGHRHIGPSSNLLCVNNPNYSQFNSTVLYFML